MHPTSRFTTTPSAVPSLGFGDKAKIEGFFDAIALGNDLTLKKIYFVYSETFNQVLHDPMTGKPVHSRHRKVLLDAAKEFQGKVLDGKTVIRLLLKHGPKSIPPDTKV